MYITANQPGLVLKRMAIPMETNEISHYEPNSEVSSDCATKDQSPLQNMKPYGDFIGFAMDIIVVQPSSTVAKGEVAADCMDGNGKAKNNDTEETSIDENQHKSPAITASSDFVVHFPDHSRLNPINEYVILVQINGRLLDESFLSMKLPDKSKERSTDEMTTCVFSQGGSAKPPTTALQELVRRGLLNPGRNLIRYVLTLRGVPVERNDGTVHKHWVMHGSSMKAEDVPSSPLGFADAHLYLWSVHDTVIISDVDGTLTKSDMRGVIDTLVTKRYSHVHDGVCAFFSNIVQHENDTNKSDASTDDNSLSPKSGQVRVLYLSARPLRFINRTRNFLCAVSQSEFNTRKCSSDCLRKSDRKNSSDSSERGINLIGMPPGPIFVHKGTLTTVLKTELLLKSTHEFKADVMARQVLLPFVAAGKKHASTLFVAGFGNKPTDALAYEMVGIEKSNIYTIDRGSLLVSTHVDLQDFDVDEEKLVMHSERDLDNAGGCGVCELLDPTNSFFTQFKADTGKGAISPTNISVSSARGAIIDSFSKKRTYEGYSDPLLTKELRKSISNNAM